MIYFTGGRGLNYYDNNYLYSEQVYSMNRKDIVTYMDQFYLPYGNSLPLPKSSTVDHLEPARKGPFYLQIIFNHNTKHSRLIKVGSVWKKRSFLQVHINEIRQKQRYFNYVIASYHVYIYTKFLN